MIYVAPSASLFGDVTIADDASVWHGAVLRGDFDGIRIGRNSNVQDNAVVHVDRGLPALVGERVTVGHSAVIHGCRIADDCLIGIHATVNSGAVVGRGCVVASGAVVKECAEIPEGTVVAGVPAREIRDVDDGLRRRIELSWKIYRDLARTSLPERPAIRGDPATRVLLDRSTEFTQLLRGR